MNREQEIIRTGYLGIGVNILVAAVKAIIGFLSGSMAIVLDALNNTTDALSSVITIVGTKLAGVPADDKHPFGYGRIEYFTAIIIAAMILVAGSTSLIESVKGIIHPTEPEYSLVGMSLILVSIGAKYFLGAYTQKKGKELSSDALISSGSDSIFDCLISVATIIAALIFYFTSWTLDAWLAAIISFLIIKAGLEMLMNPIRGLLGLRSDPELVNAMKSSVGKEDGVRGVYDVILHNYGPERNLGALHVEVDESMNASDLHHLTRKIQRKVYLEFGIFVTVGFYAHHKEGTPEALEEVAIRNMVMAMPGILGMHGFYVNHEEKMISFDVVYSFDVQNPLTLRNQIVEELAVNYPGYYTSVGLDRNYSE